MKLLIVTQVLDKNHPILGFFHRWVEEFAKNCERVTVLCLEEGEHDFPENVMVHSLGKEFQRRSFLVYVFRLNCLSLKLRKEYDVVFVHMIPEYVLSAGVLWKFLRKRVGLWYTHGSVSHSLRIAEKLVDQIFTAAKEGCNLKSMKVLVTGHGIDTERFAPCASEKSIDLVTVGRIAKSKNLESLIDSLVMVNETQQTHLSIVGDAITNAEKKYKHYIESYIEKKGVEHDVHFTGTVGQENLPEVLTSARLFVTAAQNGSLDKAVLEAMSCGLHVVSMAPGTISANLKENQVTTSSQLASQIVQLLGSGSTFAESNREEVLQNHSLKSLINKLVT